MGTSASVVLVPELEFESSTIGRLEDAGFDVAVTDSIEETLAVVEECAVDCLVSGYAVADDDGVRYMGFLKLLEALERRSTDVPCLLCPPFDDETIHKQGLDAGAAGYVPNVDDHRSTERLIERLLTLVERRRTERRAAELERITDVIRKINRALVRATSHEAVFESVCEHLTGDDAYRIAWIGTADDDGVTTRAAAPRSWDPSSLPVAPIRQAYATESVRAASDETAHAREGQSSAGSASGTTPTLVFVPIRYQDTVFEVVAVGTDREGRLYDTERDVLAELGETIGHRLAAIDDRRRLERQNTHLERLAEVISHDLQTPVSTLESMVSLLRLDLDGPDAQVEATLDDMATVVERLDEFADALPRLARESTHVERTATFELSETAESAWGAVETADLDLVIDGSRTLEGDPGRLQQVLQNLFQNVVEHGTASAGSATDEGGQASEAPAPDTSATTVTVGTTPDGFYVEDDGPGIEPNQGSEIFEYGASTGGGPGMGLAIVRTSIEAHGWTIDVTESEAGGARFEIRID